MVLVEKAIAVDTNLDVFDLDVLVGLSTCSCSGRVAPITNSCMGGLDRRPFTQGIREYHQDNAFVAPINSEIFQH